MVIDILMVCLFLFSFLFLFLFLFLFFVFVFVFCFCFLLLIQQSRLPYVAAREGHMVGILAMAHVKFQTPIPSLLWQVIYKSYNWYEQNIEG